MAVRARKIALWAATSILVLMVLAAAALYVAAGSEALRDWALDQGRQALAGEGVELKVEGAEGNILSGLKLKGVSLSWGGRTPIAVQAVSFRISLPPLLSGRVKIKDVEITGPRVEMPVDWPSSGGDSGGELPLAGLSIRGVHVTGGRLSPAGQWGPVGLLEDLEVTGWFKLDRHGMEIRARLDSSSVRMEGASGPYSVTGRAMVTGEGLKAEQVVVSRGDTRLAVDGALDWDKGLAYDARVRGPLAAPDLPVAWFGTQPPAGPFQTDVTMKGGPADTRLDARLERGKGWMTLAGSMNLEELKGRLDLAFQGFDPHAWGLSPQALTASGAGFATLDGVPTEKGHPARAELKLTGLTVKGVQATQAQVAVVLDGRRLIVEHLETQGAWGDLKAQGHMDLPLEGEPLGMEAKAQFAKLSLPPALVELVPEPLRAASLNGSILARGELPGLAVELELYDSTVMPGLDLAGLEARAKGGEQGWLLRQFAAHGSWGKASVQGEIGAEKVDAKFSLKAPRIKLALAAAGAAGLEEPPRITGSLNAEGRLWGTWQDPKLSLKAEGENLAGFDITVGRLGLELNSEGLPARRGKAVLEVEEAASGEQYWRRGRVTATLTPTVAEVDVKAADAQGWSVSFGVDSTKPMERPVQAELRRLRFQKPGEAAWVQDGEADLVLGIDQAGITGLAIASGDQHLALSAVWRGGDEVQATVEAENLSLAELTGDEMVPPTARLGGLARLSGSLDHPSMNLKGRVRGLEWEGLPSSEITFNGRYQEGLVKLAGRAFTGGERSFQLHGSMGLELSLHPPIFEPVPGSLDIRAESQDFKLAMLEPFLPGITGLEGAINLNLAARGDPESPVITGRAELDGGAFTVDATSQRFSGIQVAVELEGDRVVVRRAKLTSGGDLEASGWVRAPLPGQAGAADLKLAAQGFKISLGAWGDVTVDAEITAQGDFDGPKLQGWVRPTAAKVLINMTPEADMQEVVVLKPGQTPPPLEKAAPQMEWKPEGLLGRTDINLRCDLTHGLEVQLEQGWLQVIGEVSVKKPPNQALSYHGKVEVKRGLILVYGKRVEMDYAKVDFADKKRPDPNLDAVAQLRVGNTLVRAAVTGSATDPTVALSSEPPMSQTDILSTIIFGRQAGALDKGQNDQLAAQALALLGQQGAQELGNLFSPQLAPDVVTVHDDGDNRGSSLEAGKYLSDDLYLRYRKNLGSDGGQNVGIEYRIYDWLSIESQVGDARDTGVDVVYSFDFD